MKNILVLVFFTIIVHAIQADSYDKEYMYKFNRSALGQSTKVNKVNEIRKERGAFRKFFNNIFKTKENKAVVNHNKDVVENSTSYKEPVGNLFKDPPSNNHAIHDFELLPFGGSSYLLYLLYQQYHHEKRMQSQIEKVEMTPRPF